VTDRPPSSDDPHERARQWFAAAAATRTRDYGMPPGSWAFAFTVGPIDSKQPAASFALVPADPDERTTFRVDSALFEGITGHDLQLFGRLVDPRSTPDGPYWRVTPDDGSPPIILELWEMRALKPGTPCFAQRTWIPDVGEHASIEFSAQDFTQADVVAAIPAVRWLRAFDVVSAQGGGRIQGSYDYETHDDYAPAIYAHIYDIPERNRRVKEAKPATIANWLGTSVSSLYRYKARFSIGIRDIRRRRVSRPN
jgi:hypothetical protein